MNCVWIFAILFIVTCGAFIPPQPIWSHDQLQTNSEKWIDYWKSSPLGKIYHLYHDVNEAGIDVSKFSFQDHSEPYKPDDLD